MQQNQKKENPTLRQVLVRDLRDTDFHRGLKTDWKKLKEFLLTDEQQKEYLQFWWLKRFFVLIWWLFRAFILNLSPLRRILLVAGVIFSFFLNSTGSGNSGSTINNWHLVGGALLIFVTMLELKDKLLALRELEAGHSVQNALMPDKSPKIPGWDVWLFTRSANEVSGDLVDHLKIDGSRYGLAIGDVAGKGLSAALLAARLQATLRTLAQDLSSLEELGVKLNRIFCRDCLPNVFASMIYAELRSDSGEIKILNAGHFPPLKISNGVITKMEKGGPALALMPAAKFKEQSVELATDDILFLYSDGLIEAQNEFGDFYSEEKVLEIVPKLASLSALEIGEKILAGVDYFIGDADVKDDLSIIIIKRQGFNGT